MTAQTLILTHPDCLDHRTPPGHPESPARLETVLAALRAEPVLPVTWAEAPLASDEALLRVHSQDHLDFLTSRLPAPGARAIPVDPDTSLSAGSLAAARRAAGAVVAGVDAVMNGEARAVFCAVRPPGHHAEPEQAMGFCLFNSVAVAARHARAVHGLQRVVVVDFDVHHGNGSQTLAEQDRDFFYASIHQSPCYPGTGRADEVAHGNLINLPVAPGTGGAAWLEAFETRLLPTVAAWQPELVIISAGFDAHRDDPLANLALVADDFARATAGLCAIAPGRVVSALEGGYHLDALAACVRAHVGALIAA